MITQRDRNIVKYVEQFSSITIEQCSLLFMKDSKCKYKIAQRRLENLVENKYLKVSKTDTNENIYYIDNKLSYHDVLINTFYIHLINSGATNIIRETDKNWLNGNIISDAFYKFDYGIKDNVYRFYVVLEVSWTHKDIPIKNYEELFCKGEAHNQCQNTFPLIVVLDDTKHKNNKYYHSDMFKVIQIDFDMSNFSLIFV
jgi:hypothetical protein